MYIGCWRGSYVIFIGSGPVLLKKKLYFCDFSGGLPDPLSPLWIRACLSCGNYVTAAGKVQNMKHVETAKFRIVANPTIVKYFTCNQR